MEDNVTPLRVVRAELPEYKDAVVMLRNLANEIEQGDHGDVSTVAISLLKQSEPLSQGEHIYPAIILTGGRDSTFAHSYMAFSAAHAHLVAVLAGTNK